MRGLDASGSGCRELPQHEVQDAAVAVVAPFVRRVVWMRTNGRREAVFSIMLSVGVALIAAVLTRLLLELGRLVL